MTTLNVKNRQSLQPARRSHLQRCPLRDDRRRRDIDDASAGLLSQHLLDRELADEEKTFDVDGNERPQIVDRVIRIRARSRSARFVLKHQPLDLFTASSLAAQGFLNLPFIPTVHQKKARRRRWNNSL